MRTMTTMKALLVEPGKKPNTIEIQDDLNDFYKVLDCSGIEIPPFFSENYNDNFVDFIIDDKNKLSDKSFNRGIKLELNTEISTPDGDVLRKGDIVDFIKGSFLILGVDPKTGDHCSLTDKQVNFYTRKFLYPEILCKVDNKYTTLPDVNAVNERVEQTHKKQNSFFIR